MNIQRDRQKLKGEKNLDENIKESSITTEIKGDDEITTRNDKEKYNHGFLESSVDPLLIIGRNGRIKSVNTAAENVTGLLRDKLIGTDFSEHFTDPTKARAVHKKAYQYGKVFDYELKLKHIDGYSTPVLYNASIYKDDKGRTLGVFAAVRDITNIKDNEDELIYLKNNLELLILERTKELLIANKELISQSDEKAGIEADLVDANKDLEFQIEEKADIEAELIIANKELQYQNEEIEFLNNHDLLTNLYNRIFFDSEMERLDTSSSLPISIIVGDINGLKLVNDGFGYSKGDEMIIEIANILKKCCRENDIVGRIGGNEFAILLPNADSKSAQLVCSCIDKACKEYSIDGNVVTSSFSVGYATKTNEMELIDEVYKAAGEAMYRKKMFQSESAYSSIIASIRSVMFEKSHETSDHADRLVQFCKMIGEELSLDEEQLYNLDLLATLHDIGKMSIDDAILTKKGKLTDEEWIKMKKHPTIGFRIAQASPKLKPIAKYILYHHERWDGKGYPEGLKGKEIPLLSRILSVADAYDAMTFDRTYRKAMTKKEAIEEININSGTQFDPSIAKLFIKLIS